MKGRRLLALSVLAIALACQDQQTPTAPAAAKAPADPSAVISDGAHGGNPDFFFLPPMVPLALGNPHFELGKFNNSLKPSLRIEICELKPQYNAQGLPTAGTECVAGAPKKTFAPGTVKLVNLPRSEHGWWSLFNLPPDGFYYVLWDTRQSNLSVNSFYRIKVLIDGSTVPLGIADVDPMSSLFQWKFSRTGQVVQMIDDVLLPIPFRVERGALCTDPFLCTSATVTNHTPNGEPQIVRVQGEDGSYVAGVLIPDGFLPETGPQSVVLTITRVNTGANNVAAGTQASPCHANLPLQQFDSCFKFSTIPELAVINEEGHQFLKALTVAVCFVLADTEDPREPWVQLWSSDEGGEDAKPLPGASATQILSGPGGETCGENLQPQIGFNAQPTGISGFASAAWARVKGGLNRVFGVQTAYAVDLGIGGLAFDLSNIGPAMTARIERYTGTGLTLGAGVTTTSTVRILGTRTHNGGALTTGIGGLPVTFTVTAGSSLRLIGSEAPGVTQLTSITNTNPINAESPTSGGGFAPVNWTLPNVPGTYTLTATGQAIGGPITFTATVPALAIVVDQSHSLPPAGLSALINECCRYVAQTFTAGVTGSLVGVSVEVFTEQSVHPLNVALRTVSDGVPTSTILGERTLTTSGANLGQIVTFPEPIALTAGVQYAIVVSYPTAPPAGGGQAQGQWTGTTGDAWPGGSLYHFDGVSWFNSGGPGVDGYFRTHMSVSIPIVD